MYVLGAVISSKIKKSYLGLTYKQDTEELKLAKACLSKLISSNSLDSIVPAANVCLLHNSTTLALFMSPDQTFFLTVNALSLSIQDEQALALLISHELAHYLLDHNVKRSFVSFFWAYIHRNLFRMPSSSEIYDPLTLEFKERTKLQKFSCYYPQQRVINKFYENNCDSLAVKLWRKAYPDCDHEEVIRRLFDEK